MWSIIRSLQLLRHFHILRHCEERSDEAIQSGVRVPGLLRFARNDGTNTHAGAPDFTSLYTTESISAWNEASMMFGDTPTVVQLSPASSSLSISTRVTASVPPLRIRTR